MRSFEHKFTVKANIQEVWDFYTKLGHLERISPPELHIRVLRSSCGEQLESGADVWLEARAPLRIRWHTKISYLRPFQYEDYMMSGLFEKWKHCHKFADLGPALTEVIDEIQFELSYGLVGRMVEPIAYRQLVKIFERRRTATIEALESK